jgi:uncharacterized protein (TIGR00255 family)
MRSMTGFGAGEAPLTAEGPSGKLSIEIRSVNHRYLDVRVKAPSQLPDLASTLEVIARERLSRGRFDVTIRVEGAALGALTLDRVRARSVIAALRSLRDELAPDAEVPLSVLAAVPDLFVPSIEEHADAVREALVEAALQSLDEMRVREGDALAADLGARLGRVRELALSIGERSPLLVEQHRKRLKDRAERLRAASDIDLDAGRLEQEVVLFADRIDVSEEVTRLESHVAHFETLLRTADTVGRKLDFLLQEMAREANTVGSKSQDVPIAHAVVELKAEIERMREQAQNVE